MTSSTIALDAGLQVMTGPSDEPQWSGALAEFFDIGRQMMRRLRTDIRTGRLDAPAFLFGPTRSSATIPGLGTLVDRIETEYDIELKAPFEETDSIAGALWSGQELFGDDVEDGLAKLRFAAGTLDLPLHAHEHSDRFIVVQSGNGLFWWSDQTLKAFDGRSIRSVPVSTGDVLVFSRNLPHTFSAPQRDLILLSYHSPEIPFDDPRQFTIAEPRWTPRESPALVH